LADRLKGKVAVVTGAGSSGPGVGNGKAAAILFAREGASVLCVDIVEESAQEAVRIIESEGGVASVWVADVSRQAHCKAMTAAADQAYTPLTAARMTPEGRQAHATTTVIKEEGTVVRVTGMHESSDTWSRRRILAALAGVAPFVRGERGGARDSRVLHYTAHVPSSHATYRPGSFHLTLEAGGVEVLATTPDERQAWIDATLPIEQRFIAENERLGLPATAFIREAKARSARYEGWSDQQLWDHASGDRAVP